MTANSSTRRGELLRHHRFRLGLSQQQLAERADLSVRGVRYIEQGLSRPQAASIRRLADALGLSGPDAAALVDGSVAPPEPASGHVRIGVLGPLQVHRGDTTVEVSSDRVRTLLGFLAIQPCRTVPIAQIVDVLWGERPPRTCLELVRMYAGQVGTLLGPDTDPVAPPVLRRAGGGYRLDLTPERLDLLAMERLIRRGEEARMAGDHASALALYAEAWLGWRGPPLVDASDRLRAHPAVVALAGRRRVVVQAYADLALSLHRPAEVLPPLGTVLAEEPLHEGLAARLMLALAGDGQQAAALELYERTRDRLDRELGMSPQSELRAAHLRVLQGRVPAAAGKGPTGVPVPAQLPPDTATFVGREDDLAALDGLLGAAPANGPLLLAITGMGGVGKTSLAVRWAGRVRDRFPDGQLQVNLLGHTGAVPLPPIDALTGFLLALGVPADQIPDTQHAAAALYRSRLAGRRVLVLLDNAHDADQVRPLVPPGPGSVAVVTGRRRFTGLVARDGAHPVQLGSLTPVHAESLLTMMLDPQRVSAEPGAVSDLARLCAYLPLALRIAGANLASRRRQRIADYVSRLAADDRLAALEVDGDAGTAVHAVFTASYAALPAAERRMFRLLGLLPGPDITIEVAAALAQESPGRAERILTRLADHHMLDEHDSGRFALHDLLRLYAADLAARHTTPDERHAALDRVADAYADVLTRAADALYPHVLRLPSTGNASTPPATPVGFPASTPGSVPSPERALAWLDGERPNLVAVVRLLDAQKHHPAAARLADLLQGYFMLRRVASDWTAVAEVGLQASEATGDPTVRAAAHLGLGMLHDAYSRFADSADHLARALSLARESGWLECQAVAVNNLARIDWVAGRVPETIERLREALVLNRNAGRQAGVAVTLANLGTAHWELARTLTGTGRLAAVDGAVGYLVEAIAIHHDIGDHRNESDTVRVLAAVRRDQHQLPEALELGERALRLAEQSGDLRYIASARNTLASIHLHLRHDTDPDRRGGHTAAERLHRAALAVAREIDDRQLIAQIQIEMAEARLTTGRAATAEPAGEALALAEQIGSKLLTRHARDVLARVAERGAAPTSETSGPPPGAVTRFARRRTGSTRSG